MSYEVIVFGIIISLVFVELFGLYPGGIIVPSYLVLYIMQPSRIIVTFLVALATMALYKFVSKRTLLYGRRRFGFMIITSSLLTLIVSLVIPLYSFSSIDFRSIGIMIPGLIANNSERQGFIATTSITIVAVTFLFLLTQLFLMV